MKEILNSFEYLPMLSEFVSLLDTKEMEKKFDTYTMVGKMIFDYSDFITQPLTKGMFTPCNEEGNMYSVDTDGCIINCDCFTPSECNDQCNKYEQAKERVMFEGAINRYGLKQTGERLFELIEHLGTIEQAINNGVKLKLKG